MKSTEHPVSENCPSDHLSCPLAEKGPPSTTICTPWLHSYKLTPDCRPGPSPWEPLPHAPPASICSRPQIGTTQFAHLSSAYVSAKFRASKGKLSLRLWQRAWSCFFAKHISSIIGISGQQVARSVLAADRLASKPLHSRSAAFCV